MKIFDIIMENDAADSGSKKGKTPKLPDIKKRAVPGLKTFPGTGSHYYDMYRMGVHMAGSPEKQDMDPKSSVGNQFVTGAYSKADADIVKKSAKAMGMSTKELTTQDSKELKDINNVSPVAKKKTNKYGV